MEEFKPEFLQLLLFMESSSLIIVNIENLSNSIRYYISNLYVDTTNSYIRYTKIISNNENIAYHICEAGYLAE